MVAVAAVAAEAAAAAAAAAAERAAAEERAQRSVRHKELTIARIKQKDLGPAQRRILFDKDSKKLYRAQQRMPNQYQVDHQYGQRPYASIPDQYNSLWRSASSWLGMGA